MNELRVKFGVKESSEKKLARSTWAGHVEQMGDKKLTKITDTQKAEGKWRRGRPKMQWGIALKNDIERVGEEWGKNDR